MPPRIGVYVCHCGINIAHTVDVEAVADAATKLPNVEVARDYIYMCSDPGQQLIQDDIRELGLNRVVIATCSPRMHELTFRRVIEEADLNPYYLQIANIREQCSWVHSERESATEKAKGVVASAVSRACLLEPLEEREAQVTPTVLVIGGGIAGLQAALDVADAGYMVYIVEKEPEVGGHVAQLSKTFPTLDDAKDLLCEIVNRIQDHANVQVLTNSEVVAVDGFIGNFQVEVRQNPRGEADEDSPKAPTQQGVLELSVGSIIVATGFDMFDASLKPEFGYSGYDNVISAMEFEQLASPSSPTGGEISIGDREIRDVVFIHCVGSRDRNLGSPYCSRICCMYTAKQAHLVREMFPDARITVFYMDVRAFGKGFEEFYDRVREERVRYRRGSPSEIHRRGDRLVVRAEDTLLGRPIEVEADLVVLATGIVPREDAGDVATLLKLSRSEDGFFMELHPKLRPVDTTTDGVYLAGCCQSPKDIPDTVAQAKAAASSALISLSLGKVKVESVTCAVDPLLCSGCGLCADACVYGALSLDERRGVMTANQVVCKGCGACATACPSGAIEVKHFTPGQILAEVEAMV
ncbi:MAG: FAD-dependent oxidoreductase [Anaerolineae bacterium]|nr:FAD-dependent oxidoreductase [Anaerolineae bacterium]NIN94301.1 FAD-dependent oxidoreductase [Anaerolineae bacterium]NIQ77364.1 FAD-dependent oxidoreductase [Anaerolineae bacterium]